MPTVILLLGLYIFFSGLIYFIIRKKSISLSWRQIALFFGCKIAAGCGYGYIYKRFYNGDDTWALNHDSFLQYQRLVHTPGLFFSDLFSSNPTPDPALYFQDLKSYMEKLEYAVVTKTIAPFNLISQGNYYINIVFFSFLSFWGAWLIYKLLLEQFFPSRKFAPISVTISVFLFLPLVFWLSGIRGEGLLLLFTGLLLYYFAQALTRPRLANITVCVLSFAGTFIIRGGFALSLLPALAAWALCVRLRIKPLRAFGSIYVLLAILFLGSGFLPSPYNLMQPVVQRQQSFFSLHGNTRFNLTPLQPNAGSFISVAPEAFANTLLRPWPWEAKGALQWWVTLENILVWALIMLCLTRYRKGMTRLFNHPLSWVLLLTALCNYLLTGYVVPFPGAIVRYRVIPELMLLCWLAVAMGYGNQPITAERQI
jgi:hypothetical protein